MDHEFFDQKFKLLSAPPGTAVKQECPDCEFLRRENKLLQAEIQSLLHHNMELREVFESVHRVHRGLRATHQALRDSYKILVGLMKDFELDQLVRYSGQKVAPKEAAAAPASGKILLLKPHRS